MPAIARLSARSIGAIYRRFPDKNSLLETVFRRYYRRLSERNQESLSHLQASNRSLVALIPVIVRGIVVGQHRDRHLIAALYEFADSHSDSRFRQEAKELTAHALGVLRNLLLARRQELAHPVPERAVDMALVAISLVAHGVIQHNQTIPLSNIDEEILIQELTAMVLSYLSRKSVH